MLRERSFETGVLALNFAEGPPSGPPMVLLHGGSARWQANQTLLTALAEHLHVCAPDLREHGRSGWTPGHYRLQDYAADVAAFLRGVVHEPVSPVTHGPGGRARVRGW